jgi:proline-specific peptidase
MSAEASTQSREGFVAVPGGNVWYQVVGGGSAVPLLTLHGGPGAAHDYLEPLAVLADDRPVVFYDQLGCGRSDQPDDTSLWQIDRFVEEVGAVRAALGLDRVHLLGQSWGGWLAIEYLLSQPAGVVSAVLASTSASAPQFIEEVGGLKAALPIDMQRVLDEHEAIGDLDHPDYEAVVMEFYRRHVCRLAEWPDCLLRTFAYAAAGPVYPTMNGPNEFTMVGNLRDWERRDRLGEIQVPTLITVGRFDEITPACAETMHRAIKGSELVLFEESSHTSHLEEPDRFRAVVSEFLRSEYDPPGPVGDEPVGRRRAARRPAAPGPWPVRRPSVA